MIPVVLVGGLYGIVPSVILLFLARFIDFFQVFTISDIRLLLIYLAQDTVKALYFGAPVLYGARLKDGVYRLKHIIIFIASVTAGSFLVWFIGANFGDYSRFSSVIPPIIKTSIVGVLVHLLTARWFKKHQEMPGILNLIRLILKHESHEIAAEALAVQEKINVRLVKKILVVCKRD
jgi:hypothetical protein